MKSQESAVIPANRVEEGFEAIRVSCGKVRESFFELAGRLAHWSKQAEWIDIKDRLVSQQIISESMIKKLMVIGKNKTLMDPAHRKFLPQPSYGNYYLGGIEPKSLQTLFDKGKIHPDLSMEDCRALKEETMQHRSSLTNRVSSISDWTISIKMNKQQGKVRQMESEVTDALKHLEKTIHAIDPEARVTW